MVRGLLVGPAEQLDCSRTVHSDDDLLDLVHDPPPLVEIRGLNDDHIAVGVLRISRGTDPSASPSCAPRPRLPTTIRLARTSMRDSEQCLHRFAATMSCSTARTVRGRFRHRPVHASLAASLPYRRWRPPTGHLAQVVLRVVSGNHDHAGLAGMRFRAPCGLLASRTGTRPSRRLPGHRL